MGDQSLDFGHVSREIRSLVSRRRELMLFLASLFAAVSIYLENILEGKLPPALEALEENAFLTYSVAMLAPAVLISLRLAKLHAGMIINGAFYAKILRETSRPGADPARAARLNWGGVSTQLFLLTALIAALEAALLLLALANRPLFAVAAGAGTFAVLLMAFLRFHRQAAAFALARCAAATVEPVDPEEVEDHFSGSLEDCNHDMLAAISFVGLILFAACESLSGLGTISARRTEIASADVLAFAPAVYGALVTVTSLIGVVMYLRLALAAGKFSLELDPTDRPFRPLKLTDSLLGYLLLAFLLTVSTHLLCFPAFHNSRALWGIDAAVLALAVLAYPLTIHQAARRTRQKP
jgi:hypothetical protein